MLAERAGEQFRHGIAICRHSLGLAERLTDQPTAPECQPTAQAWVSLDGAANPGDSEVGMTGVVEHFRHQLSGVFVDERGHLAIEVRGDAVAYVRLDQALEPVARRRSAMELLEGRDERGHRRRWVDPEINQACSKLLVMVELGNGHCCKLGPILDRWGKPGILGEPFEGKELAEREGAK